MTVRQPRYIIIVMLERLTCFPLFKELSSEDLEIIAPLFSLRTYLPGETIIEQGQKAICLYLLTSGKVEIHYKPYDGEPIKLTSLQAGSAFGWSAVLGNEVYSSSVVSVMECEVLVLCGSELRTLRSDHPETGARVVDFLARSVSSRWSRAQNQVKSMIHKGVTRKTSPKGRGEEKVTTPISRSREEQVRALLNQLSAYIEQFHGGSVDFVSLNGETLKVHLGGACLGCPLSPSTLHGWVEGTVKQFFPDISQVEAA